MSDAHAAVVEFLHNEITSEVNASFPILKRVPDSLVFKFIDYVGNLPQAEQADLLRLLATKAALTLFPEHHGGMSEIIANPVYQSFVAAWSGGIAGGIRYTSINLLAGIAKDKNVGGLDGWCAKMGFTGQAMQSPQGFLPDPANIQPAKTPGLRKQIDAALKSMFAKAAPPNLAPDQPPAGPITFLSLARAKLKMPLHEGTVGSSRLKVIVEYGSKYAVHQLKYMVNLHHSGRSFRANYLSYEGLWTAGTGSWNYISEETAPRAADLLCELLSYLAELPDRLPASSRRDGSASDRSN